MTLRIFLVLIFLFSSKITLAFSPPVFTPNVVDQSSTLSVEEVHQINERIQNLQQNAEIFAAVFLVQTLGEVPIEDAAYKTFNKWQLGVESKSNGLLFIFAIDDRNARIEVGSGLEGDITDLHAKRLLDNVILPHFKSGDFATGILNGLEAAALIKTRQPLPAGLEVVSSDLGVAIHHPRAIKFYLTWLFILFGLTPFLILIEKKSAISKNAKVIFINQKYTLVESSNDHDDKASNKKTSKTKLITFFVLTIFFAINPGVFVYILSGLDEVYVPVSRGIAMMQESLVLYFWLGFLFLMPAVLKIGAVSYGKLKGNRNPDCHRPFLKNVIFLLGFDKTVNVIGKLAVFFVSSLGYAVLIANQLPLIANIILWLFGTIISLTAMTALTPLISEKAYRKNKVKARWNRIRNRATGKREIFGKVYTFPTRSSSSSGGFSSSSGGGRSSGGGASSSW